MQRSSGSEKMENTHFFTALSVLSFKKQNTKHLKESPDSVYFIFKITAEGTKANTWKVDEDQCC